jgi:hypothetical protein
MNFAFSRRPFPKWARMDPCGPVLPLRLLTVRALSRTSKQFHGADGFRRHAMGLAAGRDLKVGLNHTAPIVADKKMWPRLHTG